MSERASAYDQVLAIQHNFAHLCCKTIPASRKRHDVSLVSGSHTQRLANPEDVLAQVRFLDERVRPYSLHQLVLGDDLPTVANKNEERFEGLRGDGDGLIFAQQDLSVGVDLKRAKFVENLESCRHTSSDVEAFLAGCGHLRRSPTEIYRGRSLIWQRFYHSSVRTGPARWPERLVIPFLSIGIRDERFCKKY